MRKTHKIRSMRYFSLACILLLHCAAHPPLAAVHSCSHECSHGESTYLEYGEFAEILQLFEDELAMQEEFEESEVEEKELFFKWTKKLKKWFLKRTKTVLSKCLKLTQYPSLEEGAYAAAKFKRDIDKVCNTGSIEQILSSFDKNLPEGEKIDALEHFKDRVRFYHNNRHAKPSNFVISDEGREDRIRIPKWVIVGGLEGFCGSIIHVLPFPGCSYLGNVLITDGRIRIVSVQSPSLTAKLAKKAKKYVKSTL